MNKYKRYGLLLAQIELAAVPVMAQSTTPSISAAVYTSKAQGGR